MANTFLLLGSLLVGAMLAPATFWLGPTSLCEAGEPPVKLEWKWSKENADLVHCIDRHLEDFQVEIVRPKGIGNPLAIRVMNDGKESMSFKGHWATVFTRHDDTLYLAEYSPRSTGCKVIALDLKSGKQLWTTTLQGIGPIRHSQYFNLVNIDIDGKRIIVCGNEVGGRYVEHLDVKTGKIIANKKLEADYKSLR